jgi:hypothetical protein
MTWIHIPDDSTFSTVSPAMADSPSASDSPTRTPTSGPSPISSGTDIASKSSKPGSETATSMTLQSGTTSKVSTADPGVGPWIFSLLASRVNLTQMRASAGAPQMTGTSGPIPSESYLRWDPKWHFWRTFQASLWEMEDGQHMGGPWLDSFPKSGMTRSGELYPLPMSLRPISENDGGSRHIPTPTSADVYTGNMESSQQSDDSMHSVSLPDFVGRFPMPTSTERSGTNPNTGKGEGLSKTAKMFPTPVADGDRQTNYKQGGTALGVAARLWATPTERDSRQEDTFDTWEVRKNRKKESGSPGGLGQSLPVQVKQMLPTPSSAYAVDGSLSPDWVSWLMGLPVKWTSLEPLPREEYLYWLHAQQDGTWWQEERGLPRVATGIKDRVNRLKCLGNGIVPASLALFLRGTR